MPNSAGGSIGLGFAIPVDLANGTADELIAKGQVTRPGFGMQLQEIPQRRAGLFVLAVTSGGPAATAGILDPATSSSRSTESRLEASTS